MASSKPVLRIGPPRGPLSYYVEARAAAALGDDARSARLLANLAKSNANLSRQAISTAIRAGNFPLAIETARALPADKLALDARLVLVADALARGRSRDALQIINEQTEDGAGGFVAPLIRAWSISEGGGEGAAMLESSGAKSSLLAPTLEEQRTYLLFREGKTREAKALAASILSGAASSGERFRLSVAEALRRSGDREGALAMLSPGDVPDGVRSLKPAPAGVAVDSPARGFATQMFRLAASLAESDDRSLPVTLAQVGRLAAPDNSEGMLLLALLQERQGRKEAALETARLVPADDPFAADARDVIARELLALDRKAEALALVEAVVRARGATAADWALYGNVLEEVGRPGEAAEAFAKGRELALASGEKRAWTFSLLRADQLEKLDRWPEARTELLGALRTAPEEPLLLNYLGYGQLERGEDVVGAEAMIRKALALRPGDASITDSLGWALFKRGRVAEAIETLRRAAAADPGQWEIQEHLGDALYTSGRRIEGRFAWQAATVTAEDDDKRRLERKLDLGLTPDTAAP